MRERATAIKKSVVEREAVVRVSEFVKRYKKQMAVQGVDLEVCRGETYGLIGPDGAGKSSLLKAIAGVLTYEGGHVDVFETRVDSERAAERVKHRLGFLPQGLGLNLYPELSVEENIEFFARLRLVPPGQLTERKHRLLAMTRLDRFRDRPMKHLSGGMKQKLGLICTLIHEPELLILDEPTTGVDPVSRRDFWAILSELVQVRGLTALISTAYMDEAARFQRLSFMSQGRIVTSGTPSDVLALVPGTMVTFEASPQLDALARLKARFAQVESLGPLLHVFAEETDPECAVQCVEASLGEIQATNLRTEAPELEDVFVALLLRDQGTVGPRLLEDFDSTPSARRGTSPREPVVQAQSLVRDFGPFRAVDQVSFEIREGEIFGLLGANGAGKTTVIKMLTGILSPTAGSGWIAGADIRRAGVSLKERIGYMSQAFSLYLDLTVTENVRLFAGIYGLGPDETQERLAWIVRMAGLSGYEATLTGGLPMGVRQRLALGCALVHRPRVLFLDEPTSGVDPIGRRRFWEILSQLARQDRVAILVTTHYLTEAEHCDRLALMYAGQIVSQGSPSEMKAQVEAEAGQLLEIVADEPGAAQQQLLLAGFSGVTLFGTRLHLLSASPALDELRVRQILATSGLSVSSIGPRPLSLEDVFVYRTTALERQEVMG